MTSRFKSAISKSRHLSSTALSLRPNTFRVSCVAYIQSPRIKTTILRMSSSGSGPSPPEHVLPSSSQPSSTSSRSLLVQYSTCEVSDALVKLGVPSGGHIPDIEMYSPRSPQDASSSEPGRICGPAYTVKMVVASDKTSPKPSKHFVDACPNGHVMFVSAPSRK